MRALSPALQTRLGRRMGGLFVVGALLPIVVLAALGYGQVRSQLLRDADAQLRQAAKSVGMGLLDQLRSAHELAAAFAEGRRSGIGTGRGTDETRARAAFSALAFDDDGTTILWGEAPPTGPLSVSTLAALDSGRTVLVIAPDPAMVWMLQQPPGSKRRLWSALRPEHLFSGARERSVVGAGDASVCVRTVEGALALQCDTTATEGQAYASASWNLFLGYDYDAGLWQVEVRRPTAAVLAPIGAFRRTFFATLVAVLGLVVLLTTIQVRRSLAPLEALRAGTARLARRDFSEPVSVRSADEFEDLAGSFNSMAGQLDQQFRSNADLIGRLNDLSYGALAALARTIDASSPWTAGHSDRVTAFSLRMAARLRLGSEQLDALHRGGLLHDIGKIGISPLLLDKPGILQPDELNRIREHPMLGARILAPLAAFADAIPVVRNHHEWWDGSGYPDRLKGEDIPLLARLLSVADVYDALVSNRPYRSGWPQSHAIETIRRGAGKQFDPAMVELFLAVLQDEGDQARFGAALEAVT